MHVFVHSWIRPDLYNESGMTIIKVEMPTGFVVTRSAIERLYHSGVPGLRRARFCEQTLHVFVETVSVGCFFEGVVL